jgi:CO/xanthine dehydrogenase FAD-binding subunit
MSARYLRPKSSIEAAAMGGQHGGVWVAGGTLVMGALWPSRPETLIDLCDAGLGGIDLDTQQLRIGALTTVAELADALDPADLQLGALREAAVTFSPRVVAAVATVGGNIATLTGSLIGPLTLLNAEVEVRVAGTVERVGLRQITADQGLIERVLISRTQRSPRSSFAQIRRTPAGHGLVTVSVGDAPNGVYVVVAAGHVRHCLDFAGGTPGSELQRMVRETLPQLPPDAAASSDYRRAMAGVLVRRIVQRLREVAA